MSLMLPPQLGFRVPKGAKPAADEEKAPSLIYLQCLSTTVPSFLMVANTDAMGEINTL